MSSYVAYNRIHWNFKKKKKKKKKTKKGEKSGVGKSKKSTLMKPIKHNYYLIFQ